MSTILEDALGLPRLPLLSVKGMSVGGTHRLPPPPEVPFVLNEVGSYLDLPPIGEAISVNIPHIAEATNPGTSNPNGQSYRPVTVDQTRTVTPSTVPWKNSDGQFQMLDPGAGSKGVSVTTGGGALRNHDGSFQPRNYGMEDQCMSSDQRPGGLPMEVNADSQNLTKSARVWAEQLPIAKQVNADASRVGGVGKNHNIR
jgi:hypothetical protein